MKTPAVVLVIILCVATLAGAASAAPPKMRPYTGIGILLLPAANSDPNDPLPLYAEPGLSRQGSLNPTKIPAYNWIFGAYSSTSPLIVMGRKGSWLRVTYDDAGREAWMNPVRPVSFQSWETFFKGQVVSLLPGLQKKYLQLYLLPDMAAITSLTPRQFFKVLRMENDWAMVMLDQNSLGWLRWRDEDGRLLIGVSSATAAVRP
ncbi:MAG: hypothetical protein JJE30_18855 [Desulfuromonadales bacterium]|nr:hypothetical protein [Desulfuromonadales bacterium]